MKLSQLLEGPPEFLNKEMPVVQTSSTIRFYSDSTIKREFDIIGKVKKGEDEYWSIISKDHSFAVIGVVGVRKQDQTVGLHMLGTLDFKDHPDLSSKRPINTPEGALQIDSVVVYDKKFNGIGYELYKSLVKYGFVLVSDHTQYRGGKALWQKIVKAAVADGLEVYVIDDGEPVCDKDEEPLKYDGHNISDDKIWNEPTNNMKDSKYFTLLVLRNKK